MNDTRARFEEIWPVPGSVFWSSALGKYCAEHDRDYIISSAIKHNEYLDVFTRCQETTDVYVSLIDELVADIRYRAYHEADDEDDEKSKGLLHRANQIMEQKK